MAQIGLIFVEIALGFEKLALVHIAGNAFLRTYQLLVSPSVVSYKIREQFYNTPILLGGAGGYLPDTGTPEVWKNATLGLMAVQTEVVKP